MVEELSGPMNSEWSLGEHMPMPLDLARVDGWEKAEQIPGTKIQKDINGLYCIPNFTEFGGAFTSRFFFLTKKRVLLMLLLQTKVVRIGLLSMDLSQVLSL